MANASTTASISPRFFQARRADRLDTGGFAFRRAGLRPNMPELGEDFPPGVMHLTDDMTPSSQRIVAIQMGNARIETGCGMRNVCAFSYDQPNTAFRATPVIGCDIGTGNSSG